MSRFRPYLLSPTETYEMLDDVGKAVVLPVALSLLTHMFNQEAQVLGEKTLRQILYLIIGLVFYHIVFKKYTLRKMFPRIKTVRVEESTD